MLLPALVMAQREHGVVRTQGGSGVYVWFGRQCTVSQLTVCYVLVQCILLGVAVYVIGDDLKMGDKNGQ